jgi:hypothetical protein
MNRQLLKILGDTISTLTIFRQIVLIGYVPNMNVERNRFRCPVRIMKAELVHSTPWSFKLKFVTRLSLH